VKLGRRWFKSDRERYHRGTKSITHQKRRSPSSGGTCWIRFQFSDLCEELGLQPTVFYRWQKEFFENGASAFQSKERPARQVEEKQKRIEFLEKKVQTKDEVLAELMAEHIALKKVLGSSEQSVGAARCAG
jgi:transposase